MPTTPSPIKIGPFNLGVNNRLPDTELVVPKVGTFLRSGVNIDLTTPGTLKRRQGFMLSLAGADCHSLYAEGDNAYYVDGSTLYYLSGAPGALTKTVVREGLTVGQRLSYTDTGSGVLYTDGSAVRLLNGAQDTSLGTPPVPDTSVVGFLPILLDAMPGGSIVRFNNGRIMVAAGRLLYYSEPFSNFYDPIKNFIPFSTDITVVEPLTSGVYVATQDSTFYFSGDITDAVARKVLPYGGVAGTGGSYPDKLRCYWTSSRGVVQGDDAGEAKNVQEQNIAMDHAQAGASMFREQDGNKHVVTSLFGADNAGAAAYGFMNAEIVRKKTTL